MLVNGISITQSHEMGDPTAGATIDMGKESVDLDEAGKSALATALMPRIYELYDSERTYVVTHDWALITAVAEREQRKGLHLRTWVGGGLTCPISTKLVRTNVLANNEVMTLEEVTTDALRAKRKSLEGLEEGLDDDWCPLLTRPHGAP